nr:sulfatase-like hydrolase/transferase [Colwellia sp. Bg11-28]
MLAEKNNIDTAMLYVSDHGESLGENGIYLHGFPYAFAPKQQTHIPMLFWSNNQNKTDQNCLNNLADNTLHMIMSFTVF